jgi:hypothetical protein
VPRVPQCRSLHAALRPFGRPCSGAEPAAVPRHAHAPDPGTNLMARSCSITRRARFCPTQSPRLTCAEADACITAIPAAARFGQSRAMHRHKRSAGRPFELLPCASSERQERDEAHFSFHEDPAFSTTSDATHETAAFGRIRPRAPRKRSLMARNDVPPVSLGSSHSTFPGETLIHRRGCSRSDQAVRVSWLPWHRRGLGGATRFAWSRERARGV